MKVEIVKATHRHAMLLAPKIRQSDVNEVRVAGGINPSEALHGAIDESAAAGLSWTALVDGEPEIMFGVVPYPFGENMGIVWMLSSEKMYEAPVRAMIKTESDIYVGKMLKKFDTIFNYVHAANTKSCQWVENLGFEAIRRDEKYGVGKEPFILYARTN